MWTKVLIFIWAALLNELSSGSNPGGHLAPFIVLVDASGNAVFGLIGATGDLIEAVGNDEGDITFLDDYIK